MVEIVSIDGKNYPVKFGFNALRLFGNETGKSLAEIMTLSNDIGINDAVALMWAGLKDGHRVEKVAFIMTMDDVSDGNANVPVGTTMAKIEQEVSGDKSAQAAVFGRLAEPPVEASAGEGAGGTGAGGFAFSPLAGAAAAGARLGVQADGQAAAQGVAFGRGSSLL